MDKSIKNRKRAGLEDKYELDGCVGQGTFGMVYKAREKKNRNPVAIKMFKTTKEKEGEGISFTAVREIAVGDIRNYLKIYLHPILYLPPNFINKYS
jgi:serine/threonine protein kinase